MELRQVLTGLVFLGLAGVAAANLFCALVYGEVFLVRDAPSVTLDVSPTSFLVSAAASLTMSPVLAFMGWTAIKGARDERRFRKVLPHAPRLIDDSKVAHP